MLRLFVCILDSIQLNVYNRVNQYFQLNITIGSLYSITGIHGGIRSAGGKKNKKVNEHFS